MATGPQPSFNFHARIDRDTEERRRRLQAQTGLSASQLVREAFRELEQRSTCAAASRLPLPNANGSADLTGP
jgi:hypothetical protein